MKAGKTNFEVGTKVAIIDSEDADLVGLTGEITHPLPGMMLNGIDYVAGIWLDGKVAFTGNVCNLTITDVIEEI